MCVRTAESRVASSSSATSNATMRRWHQPSPAPKAPAQVSPRVPDQIHERPKRGKEKNITTKYRGPSEQSSPATLTAPKLRRREQGTRRGGRELPMQQTRCGRAPAAAPANERRGRASSA
eukprot:scaffold5246_cov105-Isochrysis_galbana.AAC.6